ncbi:unnamed protein product [Gongylonema pulchrum]|uniref:AGC-kinase C-terminal domain-containing protein n=1 Tax=Gongylonema pulchrum TaxID=637853 RepID=A0A183DJ63_9BILA|nr:unnamed protein product [Gongylonema pulchrum]
MLASWTGDVVGAISVFTIVLNVGYDSKSSPSDAPSAILISTKSNTDLSNFDNEFTQEAPLLTPIDRLFLMNLDQSEFEGFTFTNPEYQQYF